MKRPEYHGKYVPASTVFQRPAIVRFNISNTVTRMIITQPIHVSRLQLIIMKDEISIGQAGDGQFNTNMLDI